MDIKEKESLNCRVCLTPVSTNCLSLFEGYRNSTLFIYINTIANIDIAEGDGFPTNICKSCFLELETAVNFKEKCQQSNDFLHNNPAPNPRNTFVNQDFEVSIKNEVSDEEAREFLDTDSEDVRDERVKIEKKTKCNSEKAFISRAIDLKLICNECGQTFKSKCKLGVHWKKVHLPEALVCPDCKRRYHSYKNFINHRRNPPRNCTDIRSARIEGQGRSRMFYCNECDYKTKKALSLRSHLVIHTGEKKYQCNYCNKYFSQCSSLIGHKETVHKEIKVQMNCQHCGKVVKGRSNVYRHLKTHTDNHHECTICKKVLQSKATLAFHMKRHKGVKDLTCHICARNFFTRSELCTHIRLMHGPKTSTIYNCEHEQCNFVSRNKYVLKKHSRRHVPTSFACNMCNFYYDDQEQLDKHIQYHEHKKFKCDLCGAQFAFKKSLVRHAKSKHGSVAIKKEPEVESSDKVVI